MERGIPRLAPVLAPLQEDIEEEDPRPAFAALLGGGGRSRQTVIVKPQNRMSKAQKSVGEIAEFMRENMLVLFSSSFISKHVLL